LRKGITRKEALFKKENIKEGNPVWEREYKGRSPVWEREY